MLTRSSARLARPSSFIISSVQLRTSPAALIRNATLIRHLAIVKQTITKASRSRAQLTIRLLSSRSALGMAADIRYSAGEDVKRLEDQTWPLLTENGGRWTLSGDGKGLERDFRFKTFKITWQFMNLVADQCGKEKHHPEWSNVYNKTHIRWTTHRPEGLSQKDITMARFCDEHASRLNEIGATNN